MHKGNLTFIREILYIGCSVMMLNLTGVEFLEFLKKCEQNLSFLTPERFIPQTEVLCRGPGGVGRGPLVPVSIRPPPRASFFLVIYLSK